MVVNTETIKIKIEQIKKSRQSMLDELWVMAKENVNAILCHNMDKRVLSDKLPCYFFRDMAKIIPLKCQYSIDLTSFNGFSFGEFIIKDVNEVWRINCIRTLNGKSLIDDVKGKEFREIITLVKQILEEDAQTIQKFNPRSYYKKEIQKKLEDQISFLE